MAASLDLIWLVGARIDGEYKLLGGSNTEPYAQKTITGVPCDKRAFTVAANGTKAVYTWTADGDFELLGIASDGYVTLEIATDTPTSAENPAASGLQPLTYRLDMNSTAPFFLSSDQIWDNALAANRKIYSVTVRNKSTTAARTVKTLLAN